MNTRTLTEQSIQLVKGQVWQLQGCVLEVKRVGVHLVEFRFKKDAFTMKVRKRLGLGLQMEAIPVVVEYLKHNQAFLLINPVVAKPDLGASYFSNSPRH